MSIYQYTLSAAHADKVLRVYCIIDINIRSRYISIYQYTLSAAHVDKVLLTNPKP